MRITVGRESIETSNIVKVSRITESEVFIYLCSTQQTDSPLHLIGRDARLFNAFWEHTSLNLESEYGRLVDKQ